MRFDVLTLFPDMFHGFFGESLFHQAIRNRLVSVGVHNFRDWTHDRHHTVDDRPFGGGPGMVIKPEPVVACVEDVQAGKFGTSSAEFNAELNVDEIPETAKTSGHFIMLTPQGRPLTQKIVEELAGKTRLVFLCGRYEGFDERIAQVLAPDEISLGDYVLNGGEVAAMAIMEAVIRLIPGVLGHEESSVTDSFSHGERFLEGPQYTRPREFRGLEVPEILLNGNHAEIEKWRDVEGRRRTLERRPDLIPPDFVLNPYEKKPKKRKSKKDENDLI